MARSPASPGAPPGNYRVPGSPRPLEQPPLVALRAASSPSGRPSGSGAGSVVAIVLVTLLLGGVIGFFIGRATADGDDEQATAPPTTAPSTTAGRPPGNTVPQEPPRSPDAPPATDLPPEQLGTLDVPIPVGQPYVTGLFTIEVTSVDYDASEELQQFSDSNTPPPPGRTNVLVELDISFNESGGIGSPALIPFFLTDGDAEYRDYESSCGAVPDSLALTGALLEDGQSLTANVCFTVPVEATEDLLLATNGFAGNLHFALPPA